MLDKVESHLRYGIVLEWAQDGFISLNLMNVVKLRGELSRSKLQTLRRHPVPRRAVSSFAI